MIPFKRIISATRKARHSESRWKQNASEKRDPRIPADPERPYLIREGRRVKRKSHEGALEMFGLS